MASSPLVSLAKAWATFHKVNVEKNSLLVENYKLLRAYHSRLSKTGWFQPFSHLITLQTAENRAMWNIFNIDAQSPSQHPRSVLALFFQRFLIFLLCKCALPSGILPLSGCDINISFLSSEFNKIFIICLFYIHMTVMTHSILQKVFELVSLLSYSNQARYFLVWNEYKPRTP